VHTFRSRDDSRKRGSHETSVADQEHCDADPEPTFLFNTEPCPNFVFCSDLSSDPDPPHVALCTWIRFKQRWARATFFESAIAIPQLFRAMLLRNRNSAIPQSQFFLMSATSNPQLESFISAIFDILLTMESGRGS
jgi:hypothetical protein